MAFFPRHFAATAVLAALALPVLAQPAPAAAPTAAQTQVTAPAERGGYMRHAPDRAKMQERMAQYQANMKEKLQLTAAQEPAWNTFISAMQPGERPARLGALDRDEMQKLTTPERIDRMHALRAQRNAEADRRGEATKTFYATLTPAQQKTFDAQTQRMHRMGGPRDGKQQYMRHGMRHEMYRDKAPAPAQ